MAITDDEQWIKQHVQCKNVGPSAGRWCVGNKLNDVLHTREIVN